MDRSRRFRPLAIAMTVLILAGLALIAVSPRASAGTAIVVGSSFNGSSNSGPMPVRFSTHRGRHDRRRLTLLSS